MSDDHNRLQCAKHVVFVMMEYREDCVIGERLIREETR